MKATIMTGHISYQPEVAVKIAAEMQAADEDGWTYVADVGKGPYAPIKMYDEDGIFVDYFSL